MQKTIPVFILSLIIFSFCIKNEIKQDPLITILSSNEFETELNKLKSKENLKSSSIGVVVLDQQGKIIVNHNGEQSLTPASTLKTITTATALLILGEDFKFKTTLSYKGQINNGILKGNLYINGGGDPTLGSENHLSQLDSWVNSIKKAGINKIDGNLIADATIYDYQLIPKSWIWEDMGNYYGTGVSGLNFNRNAYKLFFQTGQKGSLAKVLKVVPDIEGLHFNNDIHISSPNSGDNGYIYGSPYNYLHYLRGSIPQSKKPFSIKGAVPDPALFTVNSLKNKLKKNNISITKKATSIRLLKNDPLKKLQHNVILHTKSLPLKDIVKQTNYKSINLYAEAILKMLGYQKYNKGETLTGLRVIKEYWSQKGVDMNGFFMEDGSGLSHSNAITCMQIASILSIVSKNDTNSSFKNSLPVVGKNGTVRYLSNNELIKGRVYAKSGYIKRVKGLVGYAYNMQNEKLTFAILINNYSGLNSEITKDMERILNMIVRLKK